jgi:spore germination protein KC
MLNIKSLSRAIAVVLFLLLVTGCWDRTEVNDVAIVVTTAFDRDKQGMFTVSAEIPLVGQLGGASGGGGGTGGNNFYIDSDKGPTIREANNRIQLRMAREMLFSHRRVVVIGEELAKNGIRELFDVIARVPENRLTTYMVVAKGEASKLLHTKPKLERFSSEVIRELVKSRPVVTLNLKDIAQMLGSQGSDPLLLIMEPRPNKMGDTQSMEIQIAGYAIFEGDQMVEELTGKEMIGVNFLRNSFERTPVTVLRENNSHLSLVVDKGTTKLKPSFGKDRFHLDVSIELTAVIMENLKLEDSSEVENITALEEALKTEVHRIVTGVLNKMKKHRSDFLALGLNLYRSKPKVWQEIHRDWKQYLSEMSFNVQVQANLGNIGLISENIASKSTE